MTKLATAAAFLLIVVSAVYLTFDIWIWTTGTLLFGSALAPLASRSGRRRLRRPIFRSIRPVERSPTDNHGHAEFMGERQALDEFGNATSGKLIGVLPSGRLLFDDCTAKNGISLEFTASGGGKTGSAATRLALLPWSYVATDPSAELAPMLYENLEAEGWRVLILNPDREPKDAYGDVVPWARHIGAVNVLGEIDVKSSIGSMRVDTIIDRMFAPSEVQQSDNTTAAFFRDSARDVVTCLTLHTLWAEPVQAAHPPRPNQWSSLDQPIFEPEQPTEMIDPPPRTLATVNDYISRGQEQLLDLLAGIKAASPSARARDMAGRIVGNNEAQGGWPGIFNEVARGTNWLTEPSLAALVSGDTINASDIIHENIAVFIQVPLSSLGTMLRVAKLLMGAFAGSLIDADGDVDVDRVHFEIEEARAFGKMPELELLRDFGRKYRVSLHMLWQSVAGMETVWGVLGRREWYTSATWRAYAAESDPIVAKEISDVSGQFGALDHSDGDNSGSSTSAGTGFGRMSRSRGKNSSTREMARNLLNPSEVKSDMDDDDMLILGLRKPLMLKRAFYWTRREVRDKVRNSRFYKDAAE